MTTLSGDQITAAISSASAQYGVPNAILTSLINVESGGNQTAQNPGSSAYGLTQLTDAAATDTGVNKYDPTQNINGGAAYLASMYSKFGNWTQALEAYNQGAGGNLSKGASYANQILTGAGMNEGSVANMLAGSDSSGASDITPSTLTTPGGVAQQGSAAVDSVGSFITKNIGNVGLVVLGVVVLAVGLATNKQVQTIVVNSAKTAA